MKCSLGKKTEINFGAKGISAKRKGEEFFCHGQNQKLLLYSQGVEQINRSPESQASSFQCELVRWMQSCKMDFLTTSPFPAVCWMPAQSRQKGRLSFVCPGGSKKPHKLRYFSGMSVLLK